MGACTLYGRVGETSKKKQNKSGYVLNGTGLCTSYFWGKQGEKTNILSLLSLMLQYTLCCTPPSLPVPPGCLIMCLQRRKIIARPANNIIVWTKRIKRPIHHHQLFVPTHRSRVLGIIQALRRRKKKVSLLREPQIERSGRFRVLK